MREHQTKLFMSPQVVIEINYTLNELETGPIEYN